MKYTHSLQYLVYEAYLCLDSIVHCIEKIRVSMSIYSPYVYDTIAFEH